MPQSDILVLCLQWQKDFGLECLQKRGAVETVCSQIRSKRPKSVLLIVDGLDEGCHFDNCIQIEKMFRNDFFPSNQSILITSRPQTVWNMNSKHSILDIDGFNMAQIEQFVKKYFSNQPDTHKPNAGKIIDLINQKERIKRLAKIPLLLRLMCASGYMCESGRLTELYDHFCDFMLIIDMMKSSVTFEISTKDFRMRSTVGRTTRRCANSLSIDLLNETNVVIPSEISS